MWDFASIRLGCAKRSLSYFSFFRAVATSLVHLQMEQRALIERISSLETTAADQDGQLAAADRTAHRRLSESRKQAAAARALQRTTSAQDTLRNKLSQVEGELAAAKM